MQELNVLYKLCMFRTDQKTKMDSGHNAYFNYTKLQICHRTPPWPLICWDIFNFSSETAEQNLTNLDREQELNIVYQVRVFRANQITKMAVLASDLLRHHFQLFLWMEFNETLQKTRTQADPKTKITVLAYLLREDSHGTQVQDMWPLSSGPNRD